MVVTLSATLWEPTPPASTPKPTLKIPSCSGLLKETYLRPNSGLPAPEVLDSPAALGLKNK